MTIDRDGARWAWTLGLHPSAADNPFRDGSDHWLCWRAGRDGLEFPEHLIAIDIEGEPCEDTYLQGIPDYDRFNRPSWET